MRREIFLPLGLTSAGFGAPGADNPGEVTQPRGHLSQDGKKMAPVIPGPFGDNLAMLGPAGTVHMSISDLGRWGMEHLRGELGAGTLLETETFQRLHRSQGDNYAYGWVDDEPEWVHGRHTIWHNGSNTMWYALVAFVPDDDIGLAVATNGSIQSSSFVHEVVTALFDRFHDDEGGEE